jgi:hypothetical protein
MLATVCEVGAEGQTAMDAGNDMGPAGAASLAPALEKLTQLTSLDLASARIRVWARLGRRGSLWLRCVLLRYVLGCDRCAVVVVRA